MIGTEAEFLALWHKERGMYESFGKLVVKTINEGTRVRLSLPEDHGFFRLPVTCRLKTETSMLTKAFQRKKYRDPYLQVEDKVGVRAVVLFTDDIREVAAVVEACDLWTWDKDRDYEEERRLKPFEFAYQSVHYVVRAVEGCRSEDCEVARGTPCEVQIRTILQHAYSELTHDTIYKPSVQAEPDVKRAAAKSMALIEATDDYFMIVRTELDRALRPSREAAEMLARLYRDRTHRDGERGSLNDLIVDHYLPLAKDVSQAALSGFLDSKPYVVERINERAVSSVLYRQPAIILLYWTIWNARNRSAIDSPLRDTELAVIYSHLGLRMPS